MGREINPFFKLFGVDQIYADFDNMVYKTGWPNGCRWLLSKLKIKYRINFKINNQKEAVIVYANHPTGLDPYLLTAALGREDSYFWGDIYQSKKGINISKHIILISPKPFWSIIRRPITNWPGYIYMRLTTPSLNSIETRRINKRSLKRTILLLKQKHQIIIFPSAGEYNFLKSGSGLSKIVKQCEEKDIPVKIVSLKIKNFGELKLLLHFIFGCKIEAVLDYNKLDVL